MSEFNLANTKGRDAVVQAQSVRRAVRVRWLDAEMRQCQSVRALRSTLAHDIGALQPEGGDWEELARRLIEGDPEVDPESFGKFLRDTSRVFVNPEGRIVHRVRQEEVVRNADGTERERRPRQVTRANTNTPEPIRLSGRLLKKSEVYNRFVFSGKRQIVHVNGLTYDFLFAIAKELDETGSLMVVGSGARGTEPIIFSRGGTPYRGFLEGRVSGEQYCLILHLSNMELKAPAPPASVAGEDGK